MLRAVLLDVGGTLWPDRLTGRSTDEPCLPQLAALLPQLDAAQCLLALRQALRADDQSLVQNTHGVLAGALQALGAQCEPEQLVAIRRAICRPAVPGIVLFPGAQELLETTREFGRVASCSATSRFAAQTSTGAISLTSALPTSLTR